MATVKESAQAYEPPTTKNIADLEKVSVTMELLDGEGKDNDNVSFKYKYIKVEGSDYRIPGTVLGGLKAILTKMPHLEYFSVLKTGTGMATKYQVIPWQAAAVEEVKAL